MKKSEIISLIIGSAAIVTGAAAYAAMKMAGEKAQPKHDPKDQMTDEPKMPEYEAASEKTEEVLTEDAPKEAEEVVIEKRETYDEAEEPAPVDVPENEQNYSNLEEYIELNPEEKKDLESVNDSFAAEGVKTDIEFSENTMFFDFVMTDVEDDETKEILKPDLEKFLSDQAETYRNIVNKIEEDTGIEGIRMIVIFMDENEKEIISGHYDSTGRTL